VSGWSVDETGQTGDNVFVYKIKGEGTKPDLAAGVPYLVQEVVAGEPVQVRMMIQNQGLSAAGPFTVRFDYSQVDPDNPYDPLLKTLLYTSNQEVVDGLGPDEEVLVDDATFIAPEGVALYEVRVTVDVSP
jgi:hypothetical protein